MKYNFQKDTHRRGTGAAKWDIIDAEGYPEDLLPMWVADMDFEVPKEVAENLRKRIDHEIFGYTMTPDSYFDAVIGWYKDRYDFQLKKEEIAQIPGVVGGINYIIRTFTEKGDNIVVQTPVYHQFMTQIEATGRTIVENPLIREDGYYTMDFDDLDKKLEDAEMMILCSPHNPVGRLWTEDELRNVGELCKKHDVLLISDEIHQDIRRKGNKHIVMNNIDDSFKDFTIVCTAPNKTFNIAGLKTANAFIQNKEMMERFKEFTASIAYNGHTILGNIAQEAAYRYGEDWWRQMNEAIDTNIDAVVEYFDEHIPEIKIRKPEATYLLWLDCSGLGLKGEELKNFFLEDAHILLNEGRVFGKEYDDHMRMNVATTKANCMEACKRIEKAVKNRK